MPCSTHRDERPRRQARGYDREYDAALREEQYQKATRCAKCGREFTEDNPKTGGHKRDVRRGGTAADGVDPWCRDCNYGWRRGQRG